MANQILQGVIDITAAWASSPTADVNANTIHNIMNIAYDNLKQLEEKERKSNG